MTETCGGCGGRLARYDDHPVAFLPGLVHVDKPCSRETSRSTPDPTVASIPPRDLSAGPGDASGPESSGTPRAPIGRPLLLAAPDPERVLGQPTRPRASRHGGDGSRLYPATEATLAGTTAGRGT